MSREPALSAVEESRAGRGHPGSTRASLGFGRLQRVHSNHNFIHAEGPRVGEKRTASDIRSKLLSRIVQNFALRKGRTSRPCLLQSDSPHADRPTRVPLSCSSATISPNLTRARFGGRNWALYCTLYSLSGGSHARPWASGCRWREEKRRPTSNPSPRLMLVECAS